MGEAAVTTMEAVGIVGAGKVGQAMAAALRRAGVSTIGPVRRGDPLPEAPLLLLTVQDRHIATVAQSVRNAAPRATLGHCSASVPLDALGAGAALVAHPLLSVSAADQSFAGVACAIDADAPATLAVAEWLATTLGMRAVRVPADRRALYHAAASVAANYLVTLEWAAETLAAPTGITRADLAPLVRAAVERWASAGFRGAVTGPVVRGDDETVARQRAAVFEAYPALLPLFDAMTDATRLALRATAPADGADTRQRDADG